MSSKLQAIADQAADHLKALIREGEEAIEAAWEACLEEALLQEQAPRLRLNYNITLDLGKDQASHDLAFGIRHRLRAVAPIPDPNQGQLPLADGQRPTVEVRLQDGTSTGPVPLDRMEKAAREARKDLRKETKQTQGNP